MRDSVPGLVIITVVFFGVSAVHISEEVADAELVSQVMR
jgi:hypothetical protein